MLNIQTLLTWAWVMNSVYCVSLWDRHIPSQLLKRTKRMILTKTEISISGHSVTFLFSSLPGNAKVPVSYKVQVGSENRHSSMVKKNIKLGI
jgi:hypothetical protein